MLQYKVTHSIHHVQSDGILDASLREIHESVPFHSTGHYMKERARARVCVCVCVCVCELNEAEYRVCLSMDSRTSILIGWRLAYSSRLYPDGGANTTFQEKHVDSDLCVSIYIYRSALQINIDAVYLWQADCKLFK
jgi:hypothetical protein